MDKIICGVYKIENEIDGKMYIGASTNIKKRWSNHKDRAFCTTDKEYNKVLYQAFREFGLDVFNFFIIEEVDDLENLRNREKYYIQQFDSENNGYNVAYAVEDKHHNHKLSKEDVIDIRTRYNNHESKRNVFYDYNHKINFTGFHKVWNGYTWKTLMMEVYTDENKKFHLYNTGSPGELNPKCKITENDVRYIREQKRSSRERKDVYKEFSDKISNGGFHSIWSGKNWKNIE